MPSLAAACATPSLPADGYSPTLRLLALRAAPEPARLEPRPPGLGTGGDRRSATILSPPRRTELRACRTQQSQPKHSRCRRGRALAQQQAARQPRRLPIICVSARAGSSSLAREAAQRSGAQRSRR